MSACATGNSGGAESGVAGRSAKIAMAYGTTVAEQDELRARPIRLFRQKYPNVTVEEKPSTRPIHLDDPWRRVEVPIPVALYAVH